MRVFRYSLLLFCLGIPATALAAQDGVAVKKCAILDDRYRDANEIGTLKKGDTVKVLRRRGGWISISAGGTKGWTRMLCIRRGDAGKKASALTEASGVLGLATGRAGSGNVVAATGVRGLDEEDLKEAKFNGQELKKLKSYAASEAKARKFAGKAGLKSKQVEFIPAAKK